MNQQQKRYLQARIDEIKDRHMMEIKTRRLRLDTTIRSAMANKQIKQKGWIDILKAIGDTNVTEDRYSNITVPMLFDGVKEFLDYAAKKREAFEANQDMRIANLVREATRIKDTVMFGDEKEAVAVLQKFADATF